MVDQGNLIDLNSADIETLVSLPGIGPAMAERIIAARPFSSPEELENVSGIGKSAVERIQPLVFVPPAESPADPIAPDDTPSEDAEEIDEEVPEEEAQDEDEGTLPAEIPADESSDDSEAVVLLPETTLSSEEMEPADEAQVEELHPPDEVILLGGPDEIYGEETDGPEPVQEAMEPPPEPVETIDAASADEEPLPLPASSQQPSDAVSTRQAFGIALTASVLTFIFSVIFTLIFLAILNGGLRYVHPNQINELGRYVNKVEGAAAQVQQELADLQARVDNLEGLSGRIASTEEEVAQLSKELAAISEQVDHLVEQADEMSEQVVETAEQVNGLQLLTTRFQNFLDGLQELLNTPAEPGAE